MPTRREAGKASAHLHAAGVRELGTSYLVYSGVSEFWVPGLSECTDVFDRCIKRHKKSLWSCWRKLENISRMMSFEQMDNDSSSVANILFLFNVRKMHILASRFEELDGVKSSIERLLQTDITHLRPVEIDAFNLLVAKISSLHMLIIREMFRKSMLSQTSKTASTSAIGIVEPPEQERLTEWYPSVQNEMENNMYERFHQARYHDGVSFGAEQLDSVEHSMWGDQGWADAPSRNNYQDYRNQPYAFEDRQKDAPYVSQGYMSIA